jgi:hypothetical protein
VLAVVLLCTIFVEPPPHPHLANPPPKAVVEEGEQKGCHRLTREDVVIFG